MAELALGLTKTVVEGALSRIQLATEEEDKLKEGVQQDLEFITGEFQMMQSFLKVANKERARKNEVVRTWVRQLRDLAFDVEDWVEFVAHLDKDKSPCSCWWRLVPSWAVPRCLAPPRHLDEAAAEMKLLRARVNNVSERNTRYNLFNSDDSGSSSSLDSKAVVPTGSNTSSTAFQVLRQVWRDETDRLRYVGNIKNLITHEVGGDDLQVIWLWGGDDRYASTYDVHMVYHDPEICQCFDRRAWVKITRPFKVEAFLKTLLAQLLFDGSSHQATNGLTSTELIQQVTKEQRYLVVLEQVPDLVEWSTIRMYLPDNKNGSRIVVSTQNLQNAIVCSGLPYLVSELRWFPDGRPSICAFYEKAAGRSDSAMDILIGKIKRGGVISVYGEGPSKSSVVKKMYLSIQQNPGLLDGVRFGGLRWVPVVDDGRPFNPVDFSRRLLLDLSHYGFYNGDLQVLFDIFYCGKHYMLRNAMGEVLIEESRYYFRQFENWLVVIDGLRFTKEWDDLVKSGTILHDMPTKCCVVIVTHDPSVARYCVGGNEDLLVHVSEQVHLGMAQRPILSCRREMAMDRIRSISDPHLTKRRLLYDDLINDCMTVRSPPVTSVWGIAGVGKSTLVTWYYFKKMLDPENEYKFSYYCWVDVPHPFSLAELSLCLLRAFFWDYPSEGKERAMIDILEGNRDPIQECCLLLKQHPGWLLVLDGLWSTDDWDSINEAFCLSQPTPWGRTIVVTNEQHVAMHCANNNKKQVISVQGLEADEALKFFKEKICEKNIDKELSESIMAKCGGLAKVIAVVAEHYNNMSSDKRTYFKLKDINDNFMHILEGLPSLRGLFSWMQHYLETCKDDLKPCIFYQPVFPIGHNIRWRRLQMRWIAEGYSRDTSSRTADYTERLLYFDKDTARLITELGEFSMCQYQPSSKPGKCRLNGFLHEYINSQPMEDSFVFALEGSCSLRSQRAGGQHLTIRENWDRDMNVFESTDFSRLRSLTVFGECRSFMFDPAKTKMKYVRVLDLEDALRVTNGDIKNIVQVFPRLKFLSLRGCSEITYLPKSLGRLRQLQTLDVRDTSIAMLPKAILKLQKLQYVRAGTIHSAPWDEGGMMDAYHAETREIISTLVPVEDGTTFVAAPSAPAKDASNASAASSDSKDTTIIETPPLSPAEVSTTFVEAPSAPAEDASTPSATTSDSEDTTIFETPPLSPAEVATTYAAAPSAPVEDASTPSATASDSEDTTIFETPPLSPAEVATTYAAAPSAPVEDASTPSATASDSEDTTIIETPPLSPIVAVAPVALAEDSSTAAAAPRSRTNALVPSWLSKLGCRSQSRLDFTNHGVEVPAGIGKLTTLQTFGVANVGPGNNSVILKELHKLTQLWRLSVCGINLDNIRKFFSAIAGLNHLCQLSVRLDKNRDGLFPSLDDTIAPPPKTLQGSLKLLGHVRILRSSWIKEFADVDTLDLEVTLQEPQDMQVILDHLIHRTIGSMKRLCIKPIQDGELHIGINDEHEFVGLDLYILEIVCTTNLQATIGNIGVDVLRIECCSGSSLQLSGLQAIYLLREVWLKGSCSDELKEDLQRQLDQRQDKIIPVLKIFQPRSS